MSTATMHPPPAIPPRPTRSQDKDEQATSLPKIPPRPIKHRPLSPSNPERFAPSPLNDSFRSKGSKPTRSSPPNGNGFPSDHIERPGSVSMPSVGEEGAEYAAVQELSSSPEQTHTRTVGPDLKLHAPKPKLPAQSAKQRVATVTRTDSDRAASFGIGKPSSDEPSTAKTSVKKKASTGQLSGSESHYEGEQGIPEIGQRVPMNPFAGDIQAPSPAPAPTSSTSEVTKTGRHHNRKLSARGFEELPPGSYGLRGHNVTSTDKLDKAYYEKHPELRNRERSVPLHDRQNDFAMSSKDLNKIVRETASQATTKTIGTPSEELGYQAHDYVSRMSSPPTKSEQRLSASIAQQQAPQAPEFSLTEPERAEGDDEVIHVEDPAVRRRSYIQFSDGDVTPPDGGEERGYSAPILAPDEVAKDPSPYEMQAAVEPRRGSSYETDDPPSRPTSRPSSIYREVMHQSNSTPLEDVREYEPLFPEEGKDAKDAPSSEQPRKPRHFFPSKDVWEDAPASAHFEAEVSTPDVSEEQPRFRPSTKSLEARTESPAVAFARHQEELAEKESRDSESFLKREQKAVPTKPRWLPLQQEHLKPERPNMAPRFPSRDVWEDTPDSHLHETTVSGPQEDEEEDVPEEPKIDPKPQVPTRPQKKLTDPNTGKPAVPGRPKPKTTFSDDKPPVPAPEVAAEKPKPQVPARPSKTLSSGSESKEIDVSSKPKPAVPARPAGGKIAALQAGFMSDLNNRLKLGMQPPKKEEPVVEDLAEEKKEKAPLVDARKGRARGPQRRAPAASPSPAPAALESKSETKSEAPALTFSFSGTTWSIDPEDGVLNVEAEEKTSKEPARTESKEVEDEPVVEKTEDDEPADSPSHDSVIEAAKQESLEVSRQPEQTPEATHEETKTLASNMAGETVVEASIEKDEDDNVEVKDTEEVAKD